MSNAPSDTLTLRSFRRKPVTMAVAVGRSQKCGRPRRVGRKMGNRCVGLRAVCGERVATVCHVWIEVSAHLGNCRSPRRAGLIIAKPVRQ